MRCVSQVYYIAVRANFAVQAKEASDSAMHGVKVTGEKVTQKAAEAKSTTDNAVCVFRIQTW